jgi:hypothetical protein
MWQLDLDPGIPMLLRNDLLHYAAPSALTQRILWIDSERAIAYVYALGVRGAQPEIATLAALVADVKAQRAQLLLVDPYLPKRGDQPLPAKHLAVRARAWEVVSALTASEPAIYQPRQRGRLVHEVGSAFDVSHPTIYRYLRRYWERGQSADALLPDYGNSGARGKTRGFSVNVKRGRPRKNGAAPGLNTDVEIRRTFSDAVARYAATHAEFSRRGAYRQMIEDFFVAREPDNLPTFGQFNYWIEKDGTTMRVA